MPLTDRFLTLREAREYLFLNGVEWSLGYIRLLVAVGNIRSRKMFNSRVVERAELDHIIKRRKPS